MNRGSNETSKLSMCVGVRFAKTRTTAIEFSRVSKQHAHPLLFPFFSHAAYDWLFQWRPAFHSKRIHLKHVATLTATTLVSTGKHQEKGETATVHVTHSGGTPVTLLPNSGLNIVSNNGLYCTPPHS